MNFSLEAKENYRILDIKFLRHAESIDNAAWRENRPWPGIPDAPLSENGIQMLSAIRQKMMGWRPDLIVASPLSRCIETALAVVGQESTEIIIHFDLRERYHNDGDIPKNGAVLRQKYPLISYIVNEGHAAQKKTESKQVFEQRVQRFFAWLYTMECTRVCIVGHRGWLLEVLGVDVENGGTILSNLMMMSYNSILSACNLEVDGVVKVISYGVVE